MAISNTKSVITDTNGLLDATIISASGGVNRIAVDANVSAAAIAYSNGVDLSGTFTTSASSGTIDSVGLNSISSVLNITAASGTTPTLFVELQNSSDGSTWNSSGGFNRMSSTGTQTIVNNCLFEQYYRYVYTITGTNPSFTFSITSNLKTQLGHATSMKRYADLVLGVSGDTSSIFDSKCFPFVSVQCVRTDALANANVQIDGSNDGTDWEALTSNIALNGSSNFIQPFYTTGVRYYRVRSVTNIGIGTPVVNIFWRAMR